MLWIIVITALIVQNVSSDCPRGCSCDHQTIDCSSKQLTQIPNDLPSEVYLGSVNNPLLPDKPTAFISFNLRDNQITDLPTLLLSDSLPYLQNLDLSKNKIELISNIQSIVLCKQLLYLKLSSNPIRNLGLNSDTVLYSPSVSHLDVSDCAISSITNPLTFMYLLNLTVLTLSGNPLVVIDNFVSNTLSHLDLSGCLFGVNDNSIREDVFSNLPKLQFLNLSMNAHLTRFPLSKPLSSTLLDLEASNCALEKVGLDSFPNLRQAILKGNMIKTLQNEMLSTNIRLQTLDVSENSIHRIEQQAFLGGFSMRKLDLSLNLLSNLDWNVFTQMPQLNVLNISRNFLTILGEISAPSLISLDASKCDIFEIKPYFLAGTQELKFLNLSHNAIERLPKTLLSNKLLTLDISYCRISDIYEGTFEGLPSISSLNFMGNRLTNPVKVSDFEHMVNLKDLNLLNNPWHCDCNDSDFVKLWKYLSSHPAKTKNLKYLICHSPKEYFGMSWGKSCFGSVTNTEDDTKSRTWFSLLVPVITLCCLLAILLVIRQAYSSHGLAVQQRESNDQRLNSNPQTQEFLSRTAPHFFDDDLDRGIQMSLNESTQASPLRELSKLPSYEEALLLPKPSIREDLKNIIKKYEDIDRFEQSTTRDVHQVASDSDHSIESSIDHPDYVNANESSIYNPSTSRH